MCKKPHSKTRKLQRGCFSPKTLGRGFIFLPKNKVETFHLLLSLSLFISVPHTVPCGTEETGFGWDEYKGDFVLRLLDTNIPSLSLAP